MWIKEDIFPWSFEVDSIIPIKIPFCSCSFIPQSDSKFFSRDMTHISWRYRTNHVKLVEGVIGQSQLLKIRYFNSDRLVRRNISHFQIHYIFTFIIQLSIGCFFTFPNCLPIFLLGFFLLLNNTLNSHLPELSCKLVNTSFRVDGKTVLYFQKFRCRVVIMLGEVDINNWVDNLEMIFWRFERHKDDLVVPLLK